MRNTDKQVSLEESNWAGTNAVFQQVRKASDTFRDVILLFPNQKSRLSNFYYDLHENECGEDTEISTSFPPSFDDEFRYRNRGQLIESAERRDTWIAAPHAWHIAPENLATVEQELFSSVELMTAKDEHDFLRKAAVLQAALRLAHFPVDVAGRTNEDFLVYLSQRFGYPLTISQNGYRLFEDKDMTNQLTDRMEKLYEDILYDFEKTDSRALFTARNQIEIRTSVKSFIHKNILSPDDRQKWREFCQDPTDKISTLLKFAFSCTCVLLTAALRDEAALEEVWETYPSLQMFYDDLSKARNRTYVSIPEEKAKTCDALMSCLAFAPVAAHHWNPELVPSYHILTSHISTGLSKLCEFGYSEMAENVRKKANMILGRKTLFDESGRAIPQ